MRCSFCKNTLANIDKYRMYCAACAATFTKQLSCPECSIPLLQIVGMGKFMCMTSNCPSRNPRYFSLPQTLSHLKECFAPYVLPLPPPAKEIRLDRVIKGPFTIMKVWRETAELDIIVEFSKPFKDSSELAWQWDDAAKTLIIQGTKDDSRELQSAIVLEEILARKLIEAPSAAKSVSKLLVITFLLA